MKAMDWALASIVSVALSCSAQPSTWHDRVMKKMKPVMTQDQLESLVEGQRVGFISCGESISANGERHGRSTRSYGPFELTFQEDSDAAPLLLAFRGRGFVYTRVGELYVRESEPGQ